MFGSPICIGAAPSLCTCRGKLLVGIPHRGTPVHAATFVRERRIILEAELFTDPRLLRLILVHELFHFVWARMGNPSRVSFTNVIERERDLRARGELGESAATWKELLAIGVGEWRNYVCESFCDTAAWLYSGVRNHNSFSLSPAWSTRRKAWFRSTVECKPLRC